jgi:hypothetical protein
MDPFFMYVSIGALVVLIIILILVGVSMSKISTMNSFPPTRNACPDYWDVSSNPQYCGIPTNNTSRNYGFIKALDNGPNGHKSVTRSDAQNIGLCAGVSGFGCKTSGSGTYLNLQDATESDFQYAQLNNNPSWGTMYPGVSETCAKKRWATMMNITWDGVTNYNGC